MSYFIYYFNDYLNTICRTFYLKAKSGIRTEGIASSAVISRDIPADDAIPSYYNNQLHYQVNYFPWDIFSSFSSLLFNLVVPEVVSVPPAA